MEKREKLQRKQREDRRLEHTERGATNQGDPMPASVAPFNIWDDMPSSVEETGNAVSSLRNNGPAQQVTPALKPRTLKNGAEPPNLATDTEVGRVNYMRQNR